MQRLQRTNEHNGRSLSGELGPHTGVGVGSWLSGVCLSTRSRPARRLVRHLTTHLLAPVVSMALAVFIRPLLPLLRSVTPVALLLWLVRLGRRVSMALLGSVGAAGVAERLDGLVEDACNCAGGLVEEQPLRLFVYGKKN